MWGCRESARIMGSSLRGEKDWQVARKRTLRAKDRSVGPFPKRPHLPDSPGTALFFLERLVDRLRAAYVRGPVGTGRVASDPLIQGAATESHRLDVPTATWRIIEAITRRAATVGGLHVVAERPYHGPVGTLSIRFVRPQEYDRMKCVLPGGARS